MVRNHRNLLIQNIEFQPSISKKVCSISNILDVTYLVNKLQKNSLWN